MLEGLAHRHYTDPELIKMSNVCRISVQRFKNASNPLARTSDEEHHRLFLAVLQPKPDFSFRYPHFGVGFCDLRTLNESSFTCEYGYSIVIGEEAVIASGRTMQDQCRNAIDKRVYIGPNARFLGIISWRTSEPRYAHLAPPKSSLVLGVDEMREDIV